MIQQGVGQLCTKNHYQETEVFLEPAQLFSGQNKKANIRRFLEMFRPKIRVSSLQIVLKSTVSSTTAITQWKIMYNKSVK